MNSGRHQRFFHVSKATNRHSIQAAGLIPKNTEFLNIKRQPGVYLFSRFDHARDWAFWFALDEGADVDIWEVTLPASYSLSPETHPEMIDIYDAWIGYRPIPAPFLGIRETQHQPQSTAEAPPLVER